MEFAFLIPLVRQWVVRCTPGPSRRVRFAKGPSCTHPRYSSGKISSEASIFFGSTYVPGTPSPPNPVTGSNTGACFILKRVRLSCIVNDCDRSHTKTPIPNLESNPSNYLVCIKQFKERKVDRKGENVRRATLIPTFLPESPFVQLEEMPMPRQELPLRSSH